MRLLALASRLITFTRLFHGLRAVLVGLTIYLLWEKTPAGAIITGVLIFYILPFLADHAVALMLSEPKGFPACPNGCCIKGDDYRHRVNKGVQSYSTYECGCGIIFLSYEKRFMRLDSDEMAHPYMIYKNRKERWVKDTGEPIDTKTAVLCAWAKELADARERKKQAEQEQAAKSNDSNES